LGPGAVHHFFFPLPGRENTHTPLPTIERGERSRSTCKSNAVPALPEQVMFWSTSSEHNAPTCPERRPAVAWAAGIQKHCDSNIEEEAQGQGGFPLKTSSDFKGKQARTIRIVIHVVLFSTSPRFTEEIFMICGCLRTAVSQISQYR